MTTDPKDAAAGAARLEWLMHHINGAELRRLGIITTGVGRGERTALDAAIVAEYHAALASEGALVENESDPVLLWAEIDALRAKLYTSPAPTEPHAGASQALVWLAAQRLRDAVARGRL